MSLRSATDFWKFSRDAPYGAISYSLRASGLLSRAPSEALKICTARAAQGESKPKNTAPRDSKSKGKIRDLISLIA